MAFPSTSLEVWFSKAKAAFRAEVGSAVDLWPNVYGVIAKALAVLSKEYDIRLAWLHRQIFVKDADPDYVVRHAFEYGLAPRAPGRATGNIDATAMSTGTINAGTAFQRSDGLVYLTSVSVIASAPGPIVLPVQSDIAGEDGNADAGGVVTLVGTSAILADSAVIGTGGIVGGTPAEATDELRARVLARKRNPPQGGSATDWERWAQEFPGVGRVWVDSFSNSDRRVWLSFTIPARAGGIPNGGDVAALQAYLSDPVRRPVTARVTAVAPVASAVNIAATDVIPLTPASVAAINAELAALFAERMECATPNRVFVLPRAWISEAISRAIGEDRHTLTLPASDLTFSTPGTLPILGTVTLS